MQNRNLTARNEKNSACDFFSHSGNFDAISCKKMREYREIAPENDPCICCGYSLDKYEFYVKMSHARKQGKKSVVSLLSQLNTDLYIKRDIPFLSLLKETRNDRNTEHLHL